MNNKYVVILVLLASALLIGNYVKLQTAGEIIVTNCDTLAGWVYDYCELSISTTVVYEGSGSLKIVPTSDVVGGGTWASYYVPQEYDVYSELHFWAYPIGLSESTGFFVFARDSSGVTYHIDCSSQLTQEAAWQQIIVDLTESGMDLATMHDFIIHWQFTQTPNTATLYIDDIRAYMPAGTPLQVKITPETATVYEGESQTFTATAYGGTGVYTYSWYVDGIAVGSTTSTCVVTETLGTHTVKCVVVDSNNTEAFSEATLIVEEHASNGQEPTETFTLTIEATEGGTVTPEPGTYSKLAGETVSIVAEANAGYFFDYFELDGTKVNQQNLTVVMDKDHTVKAYFKPTLISPSGPSQPEQNVETYLLVAVVIIALSVGVFYQMRKRRNR